MSLRASDDLEPSLALDAHLAARPRGLVLSLEVYVGQLTASDKLTRQANAVTKADNDVLAECHVGLLRKY